ncbi:MAG TPA: hypothetical protein EYG81_00165 [Archaeoglobus profundus]|nr:hypothetical protein [Archaeoglobus profundus]HIP57857.1 hypothetical protein [Archaeoglobus profundus]
MTAIKVCGLDLAGKKTKPSGIAFVTNGCLEEFLILHSDNEILHKIIENNVRVVAIDAPLSHAKGYRKVDLKMIRSGFKLLPPGWKGMKMLVERAIKIKRELEKNGIKVIETHPLSALKNADYNLSAFINLKNINLSNLSKDVVDAIICSAVAWAYVTGKVEIVRDVDGEIVLLKAP